MAVMSPVSEALAFAAAIFGVVRYTFSVAASLVPEFDKPLRTALGQIGMSSDYTFSGFLDVLTRRFSTVSRTWRLSLALAGVSVLVAAVSVLSRAASWLFLVDAEEYRFYLALLALVLASVLSAVTWKLPLVIISQRGSPKRALVAVLLTACLLYLVGLIVLCAWVVPTVLDVLEPGSAARASKYAVEEVVYPWRMWEGLASNRHLLLGFLVASCPLLFSGACCVLSVVGYTWPMVMRRVVSRAIAAILRADDPVVQTIGNQIGIMSGLLAGLGNWFAG